MATVKRGTLAVAPQWWRHLRPWWRRLFWKRERAAAAKAVREGVMDGVGRGGAAGCAGERRSERSGAVNRKGIYDGE